MAVPADVSDRGAVLWMFLLPVVFATFFGMVMGSGGASPADATAAPNREFASPEIPQSAFSGNPGIRISFGKPSPLSHAP